MKLHIWRPRHHTRFGTHGTARGPGPHWRVLSLRWLMVRVIW